MRLVRAALLVLLLAGLGWARAKAEEPSWLVVEGGTVFDGTGSVLEDAVVLVRGDRIESVGPASQVTIPPGAQRVDATGKFILPGFVDLHFHYSPQTSPWRPLLFLANGVTTQREMGNWIGDNRRWLAETAAKGLPTPRLLFSGPLLDGTNPAYPEEAFVLMDEMDARRVTNELIDQGATSLKVYFRLPLTLMKAVIEEADRRNVPVHGHLEIVDPRHAIAVGLDGFEHATSVGRALLPQKESEAFRQEVLAESAARRDGRYRVWAQVDPAGERADALIHLMLEKRVNLDATLAIFEPARGEKGNEEKWKAVENMAAFTARYHAAGGPVTIGSHGTVPNAAPGFAFQREVEAHVEAGLSVEDALQAATRVGAETLRLDDRGALAPGKLADIVILEGDPRVDLRNLSRVRTVILGGRVLDRAALLDTLPARTGEAIRTPSH